jgi:hypothetical protein
MKFRMSRLIVVSMLLLLSLSLTGCLSHWFTDSTTRLQIENKTERVFVGLDIVSEDGTSTIPWIRETLKPGERSRVYEQDWVGTFRIQLLFESGHEICAMNIETKEKECSAMYDTVTHTPLEFEFDGGSSYMILTDSDNGGVHILMH